MSRKIKLAVGVDLGGTNIKLGIVSNKGEIIRKEKLETNAAGGPEVVISQIKKGIHLLLEEENEIEGIGIGSPGVVSAKKGTVENPPNLPGWEKIDLAKIIRKEFNTIVYVENDANAAAIGEMILGAGKNFKSFIMITLGTGVGGGIVIKRKIFRGEFGAAGEIGHLSINHKGPRCNCGSHGCIETYLGNSYLTGWVRDELKQNEKSLITGLTGDNLQKVTPRIIQAAMEQGDEYASSVVRRMGEYLGAALASLSNVLDISTFIIGGGLAGFGEPLFESAEKVIKERVLTPIRERVIVIPALLKNDAGIQGASALVFYRS
jgi:glucokinase